jgi:regulator of RNase E activity RraA
MGVTDAGIFGDILCARMAKRGVAALVTDGVVRDLAGVRGTGLPVWCQGAAAPPSVAGLTFVAWGQPIACGGVAVFPDDVVVVDDDGAVLIPRRSSTSWSRMRSSRSASKSGSWARSPMARRCPASIRPMRRTLPATRKRRNERPR